MKSNIKVLVILVATITILTRFLNLDSIPPHLSNDEISIAYDAYSVLRTMRDEHNHFLPLSFQSHNTYKAPLTIYLTIPFVAIFGNTDFAARVPSAVFGSLTVLTLGLLVFELTKNKSLSLLSPFVLSISPIHILTSRMAYEANIALFFLLLGSYLFFLSLNKNNIIVIILSFVSFALSLYGYHTEWIFTPFIIGILLFFNRKNIVRKPNYLIGILIFVILVTPLFLDFLNNLHTTTRASTENILKDPSLIIKLESPNFFFWQKLAFVLQAILEKYSSYFNLSYLFFTGYNLLPQGDPFQVGIFLFPFLPFFMFGITKVPLLFKEKSKFIYTLLITSPIVASLTSGPQSTSRNLVSIIPISIISAAGIFVCFKSVKIIWKIVFIIILTVSLLYFLAIFYYHFPRDHAEGFQYGYEQIALFIKPRYRNFKKIIIDPRFGPGNIYAGVPHLYIPYFTYLDPNKLEQRRQLKQGSVFDKYEIREINWWTERVEKDILYVVPASNFPDKSLKVKKIYEIISPDSKPAFYLYTLNLNYQLPAILKAGVPFGKLITFNNF